MGKLETFDEDFPFLLEAAGIKVGPGTGDWPAARRSRFLFQGKVNESLVLNSSSQPEGGGDTGDRAARAEADAKAFFGGFGEDVMWKLYHVYKPVPTGHEKKND